MIQSSLKSLVVSLSIFLSVSLLTPNRVFSSESKASMKEKALKDIVDRQKLEEEDFEIVTESIQKFLDNPSVVTGDDSKPLQGLFRLCKLADNLYKIIPNDLNNKIKVPDGAKGFFSVWMSSATRLLQAARNQAQGVHLDFYEVLVETLSANLRVLQTPRLRGDLSNLMYGSEMQFLLDWRNAYLSDNVKWDTKKVASVPENIVPLAVYFSSLKRKISNKNSIPTAESSAGLADVSQFWNDLGKWYNAVLDSWMRTVQPVFDSGVGSSGDSRIFNEDIKDLADILIALEDFFPECLPDLDFWERLSEVFSKHWSRQDALFSSMEAIKGGLKKKSAQAMSPTQGIKSTRNADSTPEDRGSSSQKKANGKLEKPASPVDTASPSELTDSKSIKKGIFNLGLLSEGNFKAAVLVLVKKFINDKITDQKFSKDAKTLAELWENSEVKSGHSGKLKKKTSSMDRLNAVFTPEEMSKLLEDGTIAAATSADRVSKYVTSVTREFLGGTEVAPDEERVRMSNLLRFWSEASRKSNFTVERPWFDRWCDRTSRGLSALSTTGLVQTWLRLASIRVAGLKKLDKMLPIFEELQSLLAERLTDEIELELLENLLISFAKFQTQKGDLKGDLVSKLNDVSASKLTKSSMKEGRKRVIQGVLEKLNPPRLASSKEERPVVAVSASSNDWEFKNADVSQGTDFGLHTIQMSTEPASLSSSGASESLAPSMKSMPVSPSNSISSRGELLRLRAPTSAETHYQEGLRILEKGGPLARAKEFFTLAANEGSWLATLKLAELDRDGKGLKRPKYKRAIKRFQQALELGRQQEPNFENLTLEGKTTLLLDYIQQAIYNLTVLETEKCSEKSEESENDIARKKAEVEARVEEEERIAESLKASQKAETRQVLSDVISNVEPKSATQTARSVPDPVFKLREIVFATAEPIGRDRQKTIEDARKAKQAFAAENKKPTSEPKGRGDIRGVELRDLQERKRTLAEVIHAHPEWKHIISPQDVLTKMQTYPTLEILHRMLGLGHLNNYFTSLAMEMVPSELVEYYVGTPDPYLDFSISPQLQMGCFLEALKHLQEAARGEQAGDPIAQFVLAQIYEGSYPGGSLPIPYSAQNADKALGLFSDAAHRPYGESLEINQYIALAKLRMGEKMKAAKLVMIADQYFKEANDYLSKPRKFSAHSGQF